ncbi:hypothetical protein [Thermocrinis sp.]
MRNLGTFALFFIVFFSMASEKEEKEYKVLVKSLECAEKIKEKYKVKAQAGEVLVLSLTPEELTNIKKEECVKYVEEPIRLKFLDKKD